jgi:hypothetical protein
MVRRSATPGVSPRGPGASGTGHAAFARVPFRPAASYLEGQYLRSEQRDPARTHVDSCRW